MRPPHSHGQCQSRRPGTGINVHHAHLDVTTTLGALISRIFMESDPAWVWLAQPASSPSAPFH